MKRNRQIIKENYQDLDPLCSEFITWAMGDGAKSGRINPMGLLYEYYYEDNDDALLQVAEEFSDVSGYDIEEVYEAARKSANYYFHYNPIENEVNETKNMSKNIIRLTESELKQVISESVKQIISEVSWQTKLNAANKARKKVRDRIYQLGAGEIDPNGMYSKISGQYGPYTGREWKKGRKGYTTSKQELKRLLKQADNLSKYADEGIKQEFGPMSYYNDGNGVGKEYPALRRIRNNCEIGEPEVIDYYPNEDYVSGEYDDYNLADMPQEFQRKAKEVNDFQNGNYQYTKGKGWHLKDDE